MGRVIMEEQLPVGVSHGTRRMLSTFARPADSYGMVLLLIVVDYIAVATVSGSSWGRFLIVVLQGLTLLLALHTSRSSRIWQVLAGFYLVVSTISALLSALVSSVAVVSQIATITGGVLLIITPFAIVRRVITHKVVTTETLLGAVCVYLLYGFAYSYIYWAISYFSGLPFFIGVSQATVNDYLFFSFTTLTTVGYGNLIPASNVGQTFAMLEALFGQIYLVVVVARLVSLWGQERPKVEFRPPNDPNDRRPRQRTLEGGKESNPET